MRGRDRSILMSAATIAAHGSNADESLPLQPARQISNRHERGTWLSPDISPDGATLVFELLGDLFTVDTRGGSAHALTTGMAFDSQPVFSPDGHDIVFVSDVRAENVWIIGADGSNARQTDDARRQFGLYLARMERGRQVDFRVALTAPKFNGFELWQVDVASGATKLLIPMKKDSDTPRERLSSALGAFPSADAKKKPNFLYFARHIGENDFAKLPEWTIVRRDLASGATRCWSTHHPARGRICCWAAHSGRLCRTRKLLLYGSRDRGRTGLRLLTWKHSRIGGCCTRFSRMNYRPRAGEICYPGMNHPGRPRG